MQGRRSSITTLPENLTFEHGSAPADALDPQMPWNSMQNRIPDYRIPSTDTSIQYPHHVRQNAECSLGETSSGSSQNRADQNETKTDLAWNFRSRSALTFREPGTLNSNGNQTTNGPSFLLQNSSSDAFTQDLNMSSGFEDHEEDDDDCQILEFPNPHLLTGSSSENRPFTGSTSDSFSGFVVDEGEDCSLDGRRISCKRKALEVQVGPSSGPGSSNVFQNTERNQWHNVPAADFAGSMSMQTENESEPPNPRLRLGVGGGASPFSLTASRNSESSRRNFRLRINGLHQPDVAPSNPSPVEIDAGNADIPSSSRHSARLSLRNRLFDLNPTPVVENGGGSQGHSVLHHIPSVRRNPQSRWSGASSSRTTASSSVERDAALYDESRNIPRSISEHPMFIPASEIGTSSQNPTNWNLNNSIAPSTSRAGSSSGGNSSGPNWSHRNCPQYPRRLSEIVRRSLLSAAGTEPGGGQSSNHTARSSSPANPQEMDRVGSDLNVHHASNPRSALLERHLEGAFGIPYSLRTFAAAGEGRSSIMSEIRHVLDLMRRGEGLRFEDVMILDHSVLFGMADIHDRHRDMRLDVDNMSYEELLALEERIGNVCTGLTEETIMSRLKQRNYVDNNRARDEVETEPCSICREEYNDGENLGMLECGHDFHRDCIKQWLMHKNLCPICKTTGLTTT